MYTRFLLNKLDFVVIYFTYFIFLVRCIMVTINSFVYIHIYLCFCFQKYFYRSLSQLFLILFYKTVFNMTFQSFGVQVSSNVLTNEILMQ